jgi:hypothetical protein
VHIRRLTLSTLALASAAALMPGASAQAAAGASLAGPAGGHAVHFVLPKGAAAAAASSNNLVYNGGPVEQAGSTNYTIFWEPSLTASVNSVSPTYNSLISRFLTDIGGSSLYGVASQYYQVSGGVTQNIANSSTFGGSFVDTSMYPGPALTDAEIQSEVTKVMAANGWTGGIGHEFFVFTAKNEISCAGAECSNAVFCAYHTAASSAAARRSSTPTSPTPAPRRPAATHPRRPTTTSTPTAPSTSSATS